MRQRSTSTTSRIEVTNMGKHRAAVVRQGWLTCMMRGGRLPLVLQNTFKPVWTTCRC